jgi:hypothetical protein
MGPVEQLQAGNHLYTLAGDLISTYRVLVSGLLLDEITGKPLAGTFKVQVEPGSMKVQAKVIDGGLFCIAGYVEQVFPDLANTSYAVDLAVSAAGYSERSLTVNIPTNTTFPVSAPTIMLTRLPVRVQGRVVAETTTADPIAGATVSTVSDPADPEHSEVLRTPLHFDHSAGVSVVGRTLTPSGAVRHLEKEARAKDRTLTLDNRSGLSIGHILRIGAPARAEYAIIEDIAPTPLNQPGELTVSAALVRNFPAGTDVQRVTTGAIGPLKALARDVFAGFGVVFLTGDIQADTIEITDPVASRVEYHELGALTDVSGYYALDGIGLAGVLQFQAAAAGFQPMPEPVALTVNYDRSVNVVDFRLKP